VGYATYWLGNRPPASQNFEAVTIQRGKIVATVSATGSVGPAQEVTLIFRSGGKLEEGERVIIQTQSRRILEEPREMGGIGGR